MQPVVAIHRIVVPFLALGLVCTGCNGRGPGENQNNNSGAICGNDRADGEEVCDGSDLRDQDCTTVAPDFVSGELACQSDVFLAKLDPEGVHRWSQRFARNSLYEGLGGLAVDPQAHIVITGSFQSDVDFGGGTLTSNGETDIFVATFNPDGQHAWSDRYGSARFDGSFGVAVDHDGNIAVAGWFYDTITFGGETFTPITSLDDDFIALFDASGQHVWSTSLRGEPHDHGNIAMGSNGQIAWAGNILLYDEWRDISLPEGIFLDLRIALFDCW